MLFNSWEFGVLLMVTAVLYYLPTFRRHQILILITSSFIFYGFFQPWLLTLLVFSIFINAATSFKVSKASGHRQRVTWATVGVGLNLIILMFFKYSALIASSLFTNWREMNGLGALIIGIPLPIGISFFTFQGISLVVDVFKEKEGSPQRLNISGFWRHLYNTAFFKGFFPQLVSGPIVKAHDFYFQIEAKYLRQVNWQRCGREVILGYFLKCVIADNLKDQTFWISYPYFLTMSSWDLAGMLFGYSMQIFSDFSGYTFIALGVARLFGYNLPDNFNWPYISTSFSDFWRRWHISLSSFLREYLYIPLGGNRCGEARTYLNLLIVMFLGGLWHGAAWSYAVWGTTHGFALAIERLVGERVGAILSFLPSSIRTFLSWAVVFTVISWAWLLFKLPNFSEALMYVKSFMGNTHLPAGKSRLFLIALYSFPIISMHLIYLARNSRWLAKFKKYDYLIYGLMLFLWVVNSGSSGAFIYFQF